MVNVLSFQIWEHLHSVIRNWIPSSDVIKITLKRDNTAKWQHNESNMYYMF